jgi:hypothetical protein
MAKDPTKSDFTPENGLIDETIKLAAIPTGIIGGGIYASTYVRKISGENFKEIGMLNDVRKEQKIKSKPLFERGALGEDISAELNAIKKETSIAIETQITNSGYTNLFKRFKSLHPDQRTEVGVIAFTAASFVVGAMYALSENQKLLRQFRAYKGREEDNQGPSVA